jgi:hypothetical protein
MLVSGALAWVAPRAIRIASHPAGRAASAPLSGRVLTKATAPEGELMFFTYLRRELRRRRRQAAIIALGLALGIGLVVTVTALSRGVSRAQGVVLHSLYGQDTAITVTRAPAFGSGGPGSFRFPAGSSGSRPAAGSTVKVDNLTSTGLGTIAASNVATVAKLHGVAAAAGGLMLNDTKLSFTITSQSSGGGGGGGGGSVVARVAAACPIHCRSRRDLHSGVRASAHLRPSSASTAPSSGGLINRVQFAAARLLRVFFIRPTAV